MKQKVKGTHIWTIGVKHFDSDYFMIVDRYSTKLMLDARIIYTLTIAAFLESLNPSLRSKLAS